MKVLLVCVLVLPLVMAGSFEKMFQGMMEEMKGDWQKQDQDGGRKDMDWSGEGNKQKEQEGGMAEAFKKWLMGAQQKEEKKEDYKEYIKNNLAEFHEYLMKQKYKEMQEKRAKYALYQQMQAIKEKKQMIYQLRSLVDDHEAMKMKVKFGLFYNFLTFCGCESQLEVLKRLKYGAFGQSEGDMGGMRNNSMSGGSGSGGMGGNSTNYGMGDDGEYDVAEAAQYLRTLEPKELMKFIVSDAYKVMCSAAKQYLKYVGNVEMKFRSLRNQDM